MKYRITFSQVPTLQRITHGKTLYEAVYHGPGQPIEVWGDTKRAELPERVMAELARRFEAVHLQTDYYTRELFLMESKPCTI